MNVACGNLNDHNLFRLLVDSQMEVSPETLLILPMLFDMPFSLFRQYENPVVSMTM
jgi:hypothetical protein